MESSNKREEKDMATEILSSPANKQTSAEEIYAQRAFEKRNPLSGKELYEEATKDLDKYIEMLGLEDLNKK